VPELEQLRADLAKATAAAQADAAAHQALRKAKQELEAAKSKLESEMAELRAKLAKETSRLAAVNERVIELEHGACQRRTSCKRLAGGTDTSPSTCRYVRLLAFI